MNRILRLARRAIRPLRDALDNAAAALDAYAFDRYPNEDDDA